MVDNRRHAKRGNSMQMWWLWLIIVDTQRTKQYADVVELVDTLALGASASGREGSSPFIRTT